MVLLDEELRVICLTDPDPVVAVSIDVALVERVGHVLSPQGFNFGHLALCPDFSRCARIYEHGCGHDTLSAKSHLLKSSFSVPQELSRRETLQVVSFGLPQFLLIKKKFLSVLASFGKIHFYVLVFERAQIIAQEAPVRCLPQIVNRVAQSLVHADVDGIRAGSLELIVATEDQTILSAHGFYRILTLVNLFQ